MRRGKIVLLSFCVVTVASIAMFDWVTGLLTAAPQTGFAALADIHPGMRIHINTAPIEEQLLDQIRASGQTIAPAFLIKAMLPHGFAVWMAPNFERDMIEIRALVQEKRGGPLVARVLNREGAHINIDQFAFDTAGFKAPQRGAITLDGWFPVEKSAGDELFEKFTREPAPQLRELDGDHLLEVRAHNRNGAAYIIFASLLYAFEIDLDEQEEKISLASFQFVEDLSLTADVVLGNSVGFVCEMDIEPGQKDKIAIVNLKVGLEKLLERVGQEWKRKHGVVLTGQSEWRNDTLVFTYRLDDVPGLLKMLRQDESG